MLPNASTFVGSLLVTLNTASLEKCFIYHHKENYGILSPKLHFSTMSSLSGVALEVRILIQKLHVRHGQKVKSLHT